MYHIYMYCGILLCVVIELKHANTEMKEELVALKDYMERVLSTVMANKPELLELASKK